MKKTLFSMSVLVGSFMVFGQVGINTANPKSTFDITAKNATGLSTLPDGLIIPRVDRQRALSMTNVDASTLVFVNDISTGSATGQASNIDSFGFYYYDNSSGKWSKLNTDTNIYNTNGTLTANRTMNMASNSLIFRNGYETNLFFERSGTGNLQSGHNIANLYSSGYVGGTNKILSGIRTYYQGDGISTNSLMKLSVNGDSNNNLVLASNNNIGIGTDSPTQKLDVNGNVRFSQVPNSTTLSNTDRIMVLDNNGDAKKIAVDLLPQDTNIYNTDGTLTATRTMNMANNSLIFRNGSEANLYFERSGTGNLQSGQNVANLYSSGYVGGGNTILSGIRTYYQGDGTSTNSLMKLSVNGNSNNNLVLASNNNIGIGTDSPTQKLDVNGNVRFSQVPNSTALSNTDRIMVLDDNGDAKKIAVNVLQQNISKMYFKYYQLANPQGDYVLNFNTKIPTDKYTAIVVGFDTNHHSVAAGGFKNNTGAGDFQSPDILTIQENGTWRIKADMPNATTTQTGTFIWGIRLLIISNDQVTTLPNEQIDLNGNNSGSAVTTPVP